MCNNVYNVSFGTAGIAGIVCLLLSVRLAHASLIHKLAPRWQQQQQQKQQQQGAQLESKGRRINEPHEEAHEGNSPRVDSVRTVCKITKNTRVTLCVIV